MRPPLASSTILPISAASSSPLWLPLNSFVLLRLLPSLRSHSESSCIIRPPSGHLCIPDSSVFLQPALESSGLVRPSPVSSVPGLHKPVFLATTRDECYGIGHSASNPLFAVFEGRPARHLAAKRSWQGRDAGGGVSTWESMANSRPDKSRSDGRGLLLSCSLMSISKMKALLVA